MTTRYHVRLTVTIDRYIEGVCAEDAERLAIERCRAAIEPIGFSPTFHPVYPPHATNDCWKVDPNIEAVQPTLEN